MKGVSSREAEKKQLFAVRGETKKINKKGDFT